ISIPGSAARAASARRIVASRSPRFDPSATNARGTGPRLAALARPRGAGTLRGCGCAQSRCCASPRSPRRWEHRRAAARSSTPGPGNPVVVVDSGLDVTHPLFVGRPNLTLLNQQTTRGGGEDHGTEVSSLIGAGSAALGMVGVYPDAVLESWDASPFNLITDTA